MFILTHRYNVMILECRMIGDQISVITKAHGNVSHQYSPPTDGGVMAVIDPKARVIGMCLYKGLFTIIPLDKETSELRATNLRYVGNILEIVTIMCQLFYLQDGRIKCV